LHAGEQPPAGPGPDQQELALREVHDLRRLVDQHEAHRDDAVQRPDDHAVDEQLDKEVGVHGSLCYAARSAATAFEAPGPAARVSSSFSTTRSVWIREVVPSWKRITVSTCTIGVSP